MELACQDLVFHFNKKHLEDATIPMWTLKAKGQTYYVNHVECNVPWSTKETTNNPHTKGSIKIKNALLTIDHTNTAKISPLTKLDRNRLKAQLRGYTRVIWGKSQHSMISTYLVQSQVKHDTIRSFKGSCGSVYMVTDIFHKADVVALEMAYWGKFRVLQPNEYYYKVYNDPKYVEDSEGYEPEYHKEDEEDDVE